jgi:ribonuclease P protein component
MLSSNNRFHGRGSIRAVFRSGRVVRNQLFTIKYSRHQHRRSPRFAIVVSKKIAKSAVIRNRIRRRLYECFRRHLDRIDQPFDIVVIVTSVEVATRPAAELDSLVGSFLAQAGLNKTSKE